MNTNTLDKLRKLKFYGMFHARDYDSAEDLFSTLRHILDLRNCAGHTYSSSVCTTDVVDKTKADNYVAKVEAIFSRL